MAQMRAERHVARLEDVRLRARRSCSAVAEIAR
ncbi:unnamed protein product, partial [Onchocerca ochengi]|uniref:Transcriptional regulator n=1 Tax=Onchocerca ochengi TaxID=42157 RepID=A0A182EWA4_ONCOC